VPSILGLFFVLVLLIAGAAAGQGPLALTCALGLVLGLSAALTDPWGSL
jgi:hypothetical protein